MLVNGDPIFSAVNNSSYVVHHSSGRLTSVDNHPDGNVAGLTFIDFLCLPANSKLAIKCQGHGKGEGFFGVRKL